MGKANGDKHLVWDEKEKRHIFYERLLGTQCHRTQWDFFLREKKVQDWAVILGS